MTTPANRAPKFAFADNRASLCGSYPTEADAREAAARYEKQWPKAAPVTVHPIGPALPAPDRDGTTPGAALYNAMTPGSPLAWVYLPEDHRALWETRAAAVIAAHEAGREMERVVRWAVRLAPGWFGSNFCNANKSERTLFNLREHAEVIAQSFTGARIVPVPTRRRRVVKS